MTKIISLLLCFFAFSAFGSDKYKHEIIDLINSDLSFYSKIIPGMGVTGEIISDYLDEEGNYLNCTVALRGKIFF